MDPTDAVDQTEETLASTFDSSPFTEYKVSLSFAKCGPAHPSRVMESSSLAAIKLPKIRYKLNDRLLNGCLSEVQLEAILLACNSRTSLGNGRRRGILIGDGAGMGKGRTISGILLENNLTGHKKSIWISTSSHLFEDAKRDFTSVGIEGSGKLRNFRKAYDKKTFTLPRGDYCLFATYSELSGKNGKNKVKAIRNWLGRHFEGVIALDECHAVKSKDSNNHKMLTLLDSSFPQALFVYCSATAAESPSDIEYMNRLGLWGSGTVYPMGFTQLERVLRKTGFIGMETLAMELKHKGCYISRRLDLSFSEFRVEEVPLGKDEIKLYNGCARIWARMLQGVNNLVGGHGRRRLFMRYYWASHQRFFRLLNVSFKLDWVIRYTRQRISEGNAVVIGIQSTGYSKMTNNRKREYTRIPSSLLQNIKDVARYLLGDDDPHLAKNLIADARSLNLPPNFLDLLVNRLGANNVAELTGRAERLMNSGGELKWEKLKDSRVLAQQKFMSGKQQIAILSDACSCGISLHASVNCVNQRRRVHITLELPWSAEKVIQQWGRTLRSNQVSSPEYVLVVTDVAGERRFGYGISSKMQTLGAIMQGDRTLDLNSIDTFYMNSKESHNAILYTLQTIALKRKPILRYQNSNIYDFFRKAFKALLGLGLLELDGDEPSIPKKPIDVSKFLNRLLGVPLPLQNRIYGYMFDIYQLEVQQSKQLGTFEQGVLDIGKKNSFVLDSDKIPLGETTIRLLKIKADQGISWDEIIKMEQGSKFAKFYVASFDEGPHVYLVIQFVDNGKSFRVYPSGISSEDVKANEIGEYTRVPKSIARRVWKTVFDRGDRCFHKAVHCENGIARGSCSILNRYQLRCIIVGILWSNLEVISTALEKAEVKSLQLVRCQLENRSVLGLHVPVTKYEIVKELLTENL